MKTRIVTFLSLFGIGAADLIPPVAAPVWTATAGVTGASLLLTAAPAEAHPLHLGVDRRVARRTARRTSRRVTRRHLFVLPAAASLVTFGAYRYYYAGGLYYYPYFLGGRPVYVQVDVQGGRPLPPPPPSQVSMEIDY